MQGLPGRTERPAAGRDRRSEAVHALPEGRWRLFCRGWRKGWASLIGLCGRTLAQACDLGLDPQRDRGRLATGSACVLARMRSPSSNRTSSAMASRRVSLGEAAAEALGQIRGQALQQRIALGRAVPPTLLELDDAPAHVPVAGRHPCIDATRCGVAGALCQRGSRFPQGMHPRSRELDGLQPEIGSCGQHEIQGRPEGGATNTTSTPSTSP